MSDIAYRPAEPKDIVIGARFLLLGDGNILYRKRVEEVLRPDDQWKAFVADDGCRYGLDGLYVRVNP